MVEKAFYLFILVSAFLCMMSEGCLSALTEQVHLNALRWMGKRWFVTILSYYSRNDRLTFDKSSYQSYIPKIGTTIRGFLTAHISAYLHSSQV